MSQDNLEERFPCPNCGEKIITTASICHFCKTPVLSKTKGANAVLNVVWYVIAFFAIFYALNAFVWNQAEKDTARLMKQYGVEP